MIPHFDPATGLVTLYGDDDGQARGTWRMRGAVCLPCMAQQAAGPGQSLKGAILVAGQTVGQPDEVEIFAEHEFLTIGTVIFDGALTNLGAWDRYSNAWSNYYCRDYYVHGPADSVEQHRADLRRLPQTMAAMPRLIEVDWRDMQFPESSFWDRVHRGGLKYPKGGLVHSALKLYLANTRAPSPVAWAVLTLCAGAARWPAKKTA